MKLSKSYLVAAGLTAAILMGHAVPALAADAAPLPVKAYSELPNYRMPQLSPNGKQIGFVASLEGRKVLVLEDIGGANRSIIPPIENADVSHFYWANDKRVLVVYSFSERRTGSVYTTAETRLLAVDRDGRHANWIVKGKEVAALGSHVTKGRLPLAQLQDHIIDMLPDDPDHILLALDAEHQGNYEVWKLDINKGRYKIVRDPARGIQEWHVDQNHNLRFGSGYDGSELFAMIADANGTWIPLTKTDWFQYAKFEGFSTDPNVIYVRKISQYGTVGLYKLALDSGETIGTVYENPKVDIDGLVNNPETGEPAGVAYTTDRQHIYYFDPELAHIQQIVDKSLKGTDNEIVSKARGKNVFVVFARNDTDPGLYYYLDLDNRQMNVLAPRMDTIDPATQAHVQAVSIPVRDGSSIPGYLTLPKGHESAKGLKAVVLVHGGPQARDTADWDFMPQFLANRGYAVLQPNFRGSDGYGPAYMDKGMGQWGGRMQDDVTDATQWLIRQGYADKDHVCIAGISYGGYASLMGVIKEQGLYKCAASINGVTDISTLKNHDRRFIGGRVWIRDWGLDDEHDGEISPIDRVADIHVPVLLVAAKDDERLEYRWNENMADKLKGAGKDARFVTLQNGGHSLGTAEARETVLTELEAFLKANLGD